MDTVSLHGAFPRGTFHRFAYQSSTWGISNAGVGDSVFRD
jgi:hypothetical protein